MTEQELIRGIQSGERTAVNRLVDEYQRTVIKTAYYFLGDMQDAEDMAQEVFLEVCRSVGRFRQDAALSSWIYRITVNRALNELKRRKRMKLIRQAGNYFGIGPNAGENADITPKLQETPLQAEENRRLLDQTIGALPGNQRIAFILSNYEELSYKEIAGVMGTSVSSVESLIHRAKLNLRKKLAAHFSEYQKK